MPNARTTTDPVTGTDHSSTGVPSTAEASTADSVASAAGRSGIGTRTRVLDIIGLLARLIIGGALLYAGVAKVGRPEASALAVQAYQVFPYEVGQYLGYALPMVEIIIGALLILGLFTRVAAVAGGLLMAAFIVLIISAWSRGLTIDCGCFGGGGEIAPEETQYPRRIAEDVGLLLCALWLTVRPRSLVSLDRRVFGT